jgi:preprotein translocase subunit YajC
MTNLLNNFGFLLSMGTGKPGGLEPIFMLGFIAILYFFMLRPQAKKQKEQKAFGTKLAAGEKVVTIGGIHGKIIKMNDDGSLQLECDRNTFMTIEASAVSMEMTNALTKRNAPVVAK